MCTSCGVPPGAGATQVAAAILQMGVHVETNHNASKRPLLAVGQSNVAADNLTRRCITLGLDVTRFGDARLVSEDLQDVSTQQTSAAAWQKKSARSGVGKQEGK